MVSWRSKLMDHGQWAEFQENFAELFMSLGGPARMALFIQGEGHHNQQKILITSTHANLVEALSPDGWEDHPVSTGPHISFLVGHASAPEELGIVTGSN